MADINASIHFLLLIFLSSTFLHLETVKLGSCNVVLNASCTEIERKALVNFKQGLTDPSGRLSSWVGLDCCRWSGVVCNSRPPRVIKLKLRNQYARSPDPDNEATDDYGAAHAFGGEISHSLLDLKDLRYLDLSMNNFGGLEIPKFIGSFKRLRYLNLSGASFGGTIPPHLGNLSSLLYLDLNSYSLESVENDLHWLSGLSSLRHLNLGNIDFSKAAAYWHRAVNSLSSLLELRLPGCGLSSLPGLSLPFGNVTSLSVLDLSNNGFNSSIPHWLFNFSSLAYLDLNSNSLQGSVPDRFGFLISLEYIDLSFNILIGGHLPRNLGKLCNLRTLKLSFNIISGEITELIDGLSECVNSSSLESLDFGFNYKLDGFLPNSLGHLKNLKSLHLWGNSFVGSIPNTIGNLSSLQEFYISENQMNGIIPESVGQLSALVAADLSENPWVCVVTESHFSNLTSLIELSIKKSSPNITLVFNVNSKWIPPFKLSYLELQACHLGPKFPAWLRTQNQLKTIVLNNARISDSIPDWFWKLDLQLHLLDFSNNQLSGKVPNSWKFTENAVVDLSSNRFHGPFPHFSSNLSSLYLSDNSFSGPIPRDFGKTMPRLSNFDVSWNSLNGTIPLSMAKITGLTNLVISNNQLSGEIPLIWNDKPDLYEVDMAHNSLSGEIPSSMGTLNSLMFLILSGNKLSGEIPFSLQNCKDMDSFDLGDNRLSGNLPSWIGEMQSLLILSLRSNFFDGNIPSQVCNLSHLHILDLAHNNLSGSVPSCLGNLSGIATEISDERYEGRLLVVVKGRELIYQSTLYLVNIIDLSDNNLSGKLPEIRNLSRLGTLNLSINHFTGNIPEDIGGLSQLETLDLSRNQLSGPIPPSMISLTFLNHLNLSYNRLSGIIPTSNQFQTFNDPSIYRDNLALCGDPLPMKCPGDDKATTDSSRAGNEDHDDEFEMRWFYVSMGPGFVVGFWAVFGPLIINRSWRRAYFRFLDEMKDRVMVVITVNVARLQKKCKWERRQHGT
ncbi:receptor-like protein EIX2 [Vitis vinifera]|uniref:receptor-like protein EIX2 n=1 Tax=Vitis vinifera TaxID=29760 RepID=UPI00023B3584|nr:receptor-like protein EIX2 [Vitis vinifera]|eukprot:XP_003635304.1 PREDICTED: leucine-rich repeat receptor protein kinase MSP1-like [Vitis vinifera]